jgi:hypothetical protein
MPNGILTSKELFGQKQGIFTTEQLFGGQKDVLTTEELFKPETEIRAVKPTDVFKPAPFKPKPTGWTPKGIDPFTVMGDFIEKHPLTIPMGISAPVFTGISLALSKLPRASQVFKTQIEKLPEEYTYQPTLTDIDLGPAFRKTRGEATEITRNPRREAKILLDSAQIISEYLIAGKVESITSQKLLENAIKNLGGKLTAAGYGEAQVTIPRENILKVGEYTPSGEALLFNLRARKIKIPPRPPAGVTEKATEEVSRAIIPFESNIRPLPKPISPAPIQEPSILTTEELFVPQGAESLAMEKAIDKYMTGEPGKGNLYSIIKSEGGISPYTKTTAGALKEEYREDVPLVLRSKTGLPLDEMASTLAEHYPHLGITDESSLLDVLNKEKALRKQPSAGGLVHIFPQKLFKKGVAIIGRDNIIKITQDTDATDIYGNKVKLPKGEEYTPYKLSNQQILLQDGEQIVINKNQFQNIKGQNVELGEKKELWQMTQAKFENIPIIKYINERLEDEVNPLKVPERNQLGEQLVDMGLMSIDDFNAMTGQYGFGGQVTPVSTVEGKPIPSVPIKKPEIDTETLKNIEEFGKGKAELGGKGFGTLINYIGEWHTFRNVPLFAHRKIIVKALAEGKKVPQNVLDEYRDWNWPDKEGNLGTLKEAVESYGGKYIEPTKGEAGSANIEILTAPFRAIAEKLDAVQYQVKHPISKSIVNDIQYVNIKAHRSAAEWLMRMDYFKGLKKEYDTLLTDLLEDKHIDLPKEEFNKLWVLRNKIRKSLEESWQKANAIGVKVKITDETGTHWRPIGKIENYVPREIHPDIKKQLDGGLKQLYDKMLELRDRGVKQNVKQAILSEKKSGNTYIVRLLKWLEEKDMKMSASTLIRLIDKLIHRDYIASYGHLERPRLIEDALPPEFYERRASVLFTRYFSSAARRIAEIERFGQTNEKLLRRLRFVERINPQEGKILRDLLKTYQDKTKHEIANTLASIISTMKIGLGTSTIPNITQTLISTIPKQGVYNFVRGALNLIVDPQTKLFVQKTGLPYTDVVKGILGYEDYGLLGRVNDVLLTLNLFRGVNRLNALLTAASTERWIKKVLLPARNASWKLRKDWANDNLAKLKIYPKDIKEGKVSDEKLIDAMYIAALNYQLFSDITNEPLFLSKPEFRWLTILKRFGYKQGLFVMHEVIYDELKQSNPLPLLRLIASGILGGAFVIWANRKVYDTITWIKEKTTGETREPPDWYTKWDDEDISIYNKALDLISQAGTVGALSDITRLDSQGKWSLERQTEFQLKPVIVSEIERGARIADILKKGEKKVGRKTIEIEPKERILKALQEAMKAYPISKFFMEKK